MDADGLEQVTVRAYESGLTAGADDIGRALACYRPDSRSARSLAVLGGARLVRYKLAHDTDDLLAASEAYERAHHLEPTPSRAANVATALLEINEVPDQHLAEGRADRHLRAVTLLEAALEQTDESSPLWVGRATTLCSALMDAVEDDLPGASPDRLLNAAHTLVERAEAHPGRLAEPLSLLGCALLLAADRGHPRSDLDAAVHALGRSVDLTPAEHLDWPARAGNFAAALTGRYERAGALVDLRQAIDVHRLAVERMSPADDRRGQVANNLANALLSQYRNSWSESDLAAATALLPVLVEGFGPYHPEFAASRSNAGLIAREMAARRGDDVALAMAIDLHIESVEATPVGHPELPGRLASLALSLMLRFERTDRVEDLDAAIELGTTVLDADPQAQHERAIFLSSQGNAYHERFLRSGRIRDLEQSARLHLSALDIVPRNSPFAPAMLNNAAVALNDRHDRLGDPADLAAALAALRDSLGAPEGDPRGDLASRLNNLALTLHRVFEQNGDAEALTEARDVARRAHQLALAGGSETMRATTLGTLADVVASAARDTDDPVAQVQMRSIWSNPSLSVMSTRQASGSLWLLRRALQDTTSTAGERRGLLHRAAAAGAVNRPAVALAAARQLGVDGLVDQTAGHGSAAAVEHAARLASEATARLRADQGELRHALSWQRQVSGIAAVLAQSRFLRGDLDGSVAAFEEGHAVLLTSKLAPPPGIRPHGCTITAWATPVGGAAVVQRDGRPARGVNLPQLTSDTVATWSRLLDKGARLGPAVLERVLSRTASAITSALTSPVLEVVPVGEPLTWVSGGLIGLLAVGASCAADGMLVAERHETRHALTASLASWAESTAAQRPLAPGGWCSIGSPAPSSFPPLLGASAEMAAFADPADRYAGDGATPAAVVRALRVSPVVHVATHARVSAADPLMNHLLLADDEPLYADDVAGLSSSARLVVLSACDTAAPGAAHADEGLGLAGAFQAAGVPGVIASRWSVGDRGTSAFMARAAALLKDGLTPARALHQASSQARDAGDPAREWSAFGIWGC